MPGIAAVDTLTAQPTLAGEPMKSSQANAGGGMLFARNAQANFTAEAQRTQRREELYVFVLLAFSGCQSRVSSR